MTDPKVTKAQGMLPPGLMISAPASGTGKTTVMLGLLRAIKERGLAVQPFKSGPDYIDPAFHRAASGRAAFNLDTWAMTPALLDSLAQEGAGGDIVIAEGSMGLFDGVATRGQAGCGSSAETAIRFGWPVILVVDVSGQAQSAAATALGFAKYHPDLHVAGVILNRVASPRHERLARVGFDAVGIPVLGALPRQGDLRLPERHLGLVQAIEHPDLESAILTYAAFLSQHVDLDQVIDMARSHPARENHDLEPYAPAGRIALASDAAFSFTYPHQLRAWRAAGATILPFSPLADEAPDSAADLIWLPGGYPELHAGKLSAAERFKTACREHAKTRPIHGECGGYMTLGAGLVDKDGTRHEMLGLLGLETSFEKRTFHLGYRRAVLKSPALGFEAGAALRGHEFHYARIIHQPDEPFADVFDADGNAVAETGSKRAHVSGSFFHLIAEDRP